MKFQHKQININSDFPIALAGFIQQGEPISEIHDDCHARIFAFSDDRYLIYLISCDNLGLPISLQQALQERLQANSDKEVRVTISCTHTHFAPDPKNERYRNALLEKLTKACETMVLEDGNYEISFQREFFDGLGKSRISHHETKHIYVQLLQIFQDGKRKAVMITHNAHPTIHNGDTPYVTAEYPGYVISVCAKRHPEVAFTFMQGADGDISTRFTRRSQDWDGMKELGDRLADHIETMLNKPVDKQPLDTLNYECITFPLEHTFEQIDISNLPDYLTQREIETIHIGAKVRENLAKKLDTLDRELLLSKVQLGPYSLVFSPNELFSSYHDFINLDHAILVCYSNGYSPYVTGLDDDFITYETFTDTLTLACKKQYGAHLKKLSQ